VKTYKINEFITLKLEGKKTIIYVNNKRFDQCKFLLLNIPIKEIPSTYKINSIDEAEEILGTDIENNIEIAPEEEFWAHCSNLQAWVESGYNTNLLHRELSFYLLEDLYKAGDKVAKKVLKKEIMKRILEGHVNTVFFLTEEGVLKRSGFTKEEMSILFIKDNKKLREKIELLLKSKSFEELLNNSVLYLLDNLRKYGDLDAEKVLKQKLIELYETGDYNLIWDYQMHKRFDIFTNEELISLIFNSKSPLTKKLTKIIEENKASKSCVIKLLNDLNKLNQEVTKKVLVRTLLTFGVNYPIKKALINKILKDFKFYVKDKKCSFVSHYLHFPFKI